MLQEAVGEVLLTYDDTLEVRGWAERYGFKVRRISMRTTHHRMKRELLIARNFDWLR
jgi:DNA adenine methylase